MDRKVFFANVKRDLFNGRMTQKQVAGITRLLDAWALYGNGLDNAQAYILTTSYHETGRRMQPVLETYAKTRRQAAERLQRAWKRGKLKWVKAPYWNLVNGHHWVGGGDVQLTHEYNYNGPLRDVVLKELNVDIHADPDQVLNPIVSALVLIEGVTSRATLRGDFTGKSLGQYVNARKSDYHNARKTVNPGEKSSYAKLARYALKFEHAIREGRAAAGEAFVGPSPDMYSGRYSVSVKRVQVRLKELGYHDVGTPDGKWGTRTAGAVLAFRNDKGLPLVTKIDKDLLAALMESEDRLIVPERSEATLADLRDMGSTDVKRADDGIKLGTLATIGSGVAAGGGVLEKLTGVTDKVSDITGKAEESIGIVEQGLDLFRPVASFVSDNALIFLGGVGLFILWQALQARNNRLKKHQSGEYQSR